LCESAPVPYDARVTTIGCIIMSGMALGAAGTWPAPQDWVRDGDGPAIALGEPGASDDTHIFAPCVAYEDGVYSLWYCGSRGAVADRVFRMGLATSRDGVHFEKHGDNPVYEFGDGKGSVLTPTLLRNANGSVRREGGRLRMWFAGADLTDPASLHRLHETSSADGITWAAPSPPQLDHVYAPTILWDDGRYRMWYSHVEDEPWVVKHAASDDGVHWDVTDEPCIVIDQEWEERRLFYPTVLKADGQYLLFYGSYWSAHEQKTALGLAISDDGLTWHKHAQNPVFTPEPSRPWESHYTTSQSVIPAADGGWRIWYATRKAPPHVNKYFAIGTAHWKGPAMQAWPERAATLRQRMAKTLTLPDKRVDLAPQTHNTLDGEGYRVESITYASETGSRVTALLYLPEPSDKPVPAVVVACGHGGSKSALYAQYAGQLYAKMGFACLAVDTIGEEERHVDGGMGTRAHNMYKFNDEERLDFVNTKLKRSVLGKIVWDLMCGIDYLETRPEIDGRRVGVVGYSLGGTSSGALANLDSRVRAAVICGWGFIPSLAVYGKHCTRLPYEAFSEIMSFGEMNALLAPHAATLFLSGDSDSVIDKDEGGALLVRGIREGIDEAHRILDEAGIEHTIDSHFVEGACHRPLFLTHRAVEWMQQHLMTTDERRPIPDTPIKYSDWVEAHGQEIEQLYNTEARERGTMVVDVGVTHHDPRALACFPDQERPPKEYTFQGWVDSVLAGGKAQ
jgi:cephalosporin-C deacetylase-like acetyl esterase